MTYLTITSDEALAMLARGHVLLIDVRTPDEFEESHIPGAINLPLYELLELIEEIVPELDQHIVIYCQTGRRSQSAAQALVYVGYTAVYDLGGIEDWTGEIQ